MDKNEQDEVKKKYALTDKELEEMYFQAKSLIFTGSKPAINRPEAIVTGGQPGAGKSAIVLKSKYDFAQEGRESIILDVDTYRGLYKNAVKIAQKYPELYSEITDGAVGKVMERLIDDAIAGGYNFIFEGTMGKSASILDKLQASKNNYGITVRLMAVSREESLLSIFERYLEMRKSMGMGRLTTIHAHDVRYTGLLEVSKTLEERGIETEVYERGIVQRIPKLTYKTSASKNIYSSVYEALINGRNESRRICMLDAKERLDSIISEINLYFSNDKKIVEQLERLILVITEELDRENGER